MRDRNGRLPAATVMGPNGGSTDALGLLAKIVSTLDVLSGGRVELGIGAGWMGSDYEQAGMSYDRPGVRVDRMIEAVQIIKALHGDGPVDFKGDHYMITGHDALPKPVQRPHTPIMIGAGGKRLLTFAAGEADIIGLNPKNLGNDAWADTNVGDATDEATDRKVSWIREAAGSRFDAIELSIVVPFIIETDNRAAMAEGIAAFSRPGVELTKRTLWSGLDAASLEAHMQAEGLGQLYVRLLTDNFEEAVAARAEKRPAVFRDDK